MSVSVNWWWTSCSHSNLPSLFFVGLLDNYFPVGCSNNSVCHWQQIFCVVLGKLNSFAHQPNPLSLPSPLNDVLSSQQNHNEDKWIPVIMLTSLSRFCFSFPTHSPSIDLLLLGPNKLTKPYLRVLLVICSLIAKLVQNNRVWIHNWLAYQ